LASYERKDIGKEFLERSKDYQRYFSLLSVYYVEYVKFYAEKLRYNVRSKLSMHNLFCMAFLFELNDDTGEWKNKGSKAAAGVAEGSRIM
jgi:predicted transcriptional regulator